MLFLAVRLVIMAPMERLCDAHLHFFTREVLRFYARQSAEYGALKDPTTRVAERLGISPPPREPEDLAAQWAEELERHHVSRAFLFGSGPGEQRSVSRAVEAFPQRFVGFQMLNPRDPEAARATADIAAKGLRGLLLFPAMHLFFPDDPACLDTCRLARKYGLIVFVHIGPLRIVIQEKLGGGGASQQRYGDARRLGNALRAFPEVPFIVPHFGCGRLAGVLESARESRNLYLDTSSSNSWMQQAPESTDLETVFGKILEEKAFGPERLLFGSDSTVFPRGWRTDIHRTQRAVLDRLGVSSRERQLIFSRNLERLLEPAGGATRPTA